MEKSKHKLKGVRFPSFANAANHAPDRHRSPGLGDNPENKQWVSHTGRRQRLKYLRRIAKPYLESRDADVQKIVAKLRDMTAGEPEPEYGLLHLICAATDAAEGTGATWLQSAEYLASKFAEAVA